MKLPSKESHTITLSVPNFHCCRSRLLVWHIWKEQSQKCITMSCLSVCNNSKICWLYFQEML